MSGGPGTIKSTDTEPRKRQDITSMSDVSIQCWEFTGIDTENNQVGIPFFDLTSSTENVMLMSNTHVQQKTTNNKK